MILNKASFRSLTVVSAVSLLALAGCSQPVPAESTAATASEAPDQAYPMSVTNCGTTLEIQAAPQRIVTLEQTMTELSLSLGVEDRMVGTSYLTDPVLPELQAAYDTVPVLAELYPSQEVVIEAAPDFIYAYSPTSVSAENAGTPESWAELGVPVYVSPISCLDPEESDGQITFEGWFDEVRTIAAIYGVPEAGEELIADQQARIDAALAKAEDGEGRSFLWWFAGTDEPYFGTGTSDAENYANLLGLENAFSDGGPDRWSSTSWEIIAERDPDFIVLADLIRGNDGDSAQSKIDFLKSNPVTAELSAVKNDRFIVVPGVARGYSVRTVESLELIVDGMNSFE
ncbi:MAG: ABC transporter substrate-binding protein [Arachnia sp.]